MNSKFRFLLPICLCICCLMAVMDLSAKGIEDLNEKIKDYEYVGHFSEGLAVVKKEGKIGFVDTHHKVNPIGSHWLRNERIRTLSWHHRLYSQIPIPETTMNRLIFSNH